ncbi:MAG: hypothetical protein PUB19_06805 [Lachnospiraceae bacterium]|nr:hypothetical protein [Lachnospiraceae bacterium]
MIIQSQDISMQGKRSYKQNATVTFQQTGKPLGQNGLHNLAAGVSGNGNFLGTLNYYLDASGKLVSEDMPSDSGVKRDTKTEGISGVGEDSMLSSARIQFETLNYLLHIFFMKGKRDFRDELQNVLESKTTLLEGVGPSWQVVSSEQLYTYGETETTTFSTQGKVVTADGREIDFGIEVGMSRSFYQEVYQKSVGLSPVMCDPLVINLDGDVANVSDQKFFFDLDCDGEEDEISMLGEGSGFLALDINGDGKINDGSELFGTKSGNGFYDLSQYDLDGNGWIDEADEIFERLQIWVPSEDGTGTCYKLKEEGVGAICLQNVSTEFSLRGQEQQLNGAIRCSGIFLMESGEVGTIQHVDLAM